MTCVCKMSVLVGVAILCQVVTGSPSNRDTSSTSVEGMYSEESSLPSTAFQHGRGRPDMFWNDRSAQQNMAAKFSPQITHPIQPVRTIIQRGPMALEGSGTRLQPLPPRPSFIPDPPNLLSTVANTIRNVASVIHDVPKAAGAFGSSGAVIISENVQTVLNTPAIISSGSTSAVSSSRVVYPPQVVQPSRPPQVVQPSRPSRPANRQTQTQVSQSRPTRPSTSAQNSFPIVVVNSNQNGSPKPTKFVPQTIHQSGPSIPVAFGGIEPPSDYVPQNELFVLENFDAFGAINPANTQSSQGSFNGGGSPNLFPSQNTNTNFGSSTGSANGGGSSSAFPSQNTQNTNTNIGSSTGSANGGGSPSAFPFQNTQNTNTNIGSSTGSANGGGSPSAFPFQNTQNTNTNIGSSTGSANGGGSPSAFPSQNTDIFGSSTGSFKGESSQQPSTGINQFPSQNTYNFDRGQSYPDISTAVNGIQEFTLDLLSTFKKGSQDTVVYSPVSISSLLSLLTLATNGNSKQEIEGALFPFSSPSSNDYHSQYQAILERLNHYSQGVTISTASRLFLEQSVSIFGSFTNAAKKHYNCSASLENFRRKPEQVMKRVNRWVKEETHGKITEFISQPFSTDTKFVAANTIYFNGEWATPFPEYFTAEREFDTGNEVIQIPMMTNVFETPHYYSKELNVDVTSLPYTGGEFAMIIILPRESPRDKSIIDLEKQLNTSTIDSLVRNLTSKSVSVSLPKMKLALKTSLVENLSELGIRSIFSPSTADFSSLTNAKPLWVSQFLHEAVMEVTELGTVAAAVSAASLDRIGGYQRINVNKPAIILIRDMVTGMPLFWTRLVKPERVPESGQSKAPSPTKF